jgi:signal transduction histidine kinase
MPAWDHRNTGSPVKRRSANRLQWIAAGILAILCGGLAILQYRWTGALSTAELDHLQKQARQNLEQLRVDFNGRIASAVAAVTPSPGEVETAGTEAYWARVARWRERHEPVFSRIGLAIPNRNDLGLMIAGASSFEKSEWPEEWLPLKQWLAGHIGGTQPARPAPSAEPASLGILEIPHFGRPKNGEPATEQEWLLLEVDRKWMAGTLVPELLARHLGAGSFDAAIFTDTGPGPAGGRSRELIYESAPGIGREIGALADAEVDILPNVRGGRGRGPEGFRGGPGRRDDFGGPGRWHLEIRHHAGSLETIVAQSRRRNLAVSVGVLLLIFITSALLLRTAREQTRLAELQMNFVAGVSHELRTPLTVIRTAAFNLQRKLAGRPEQAERYGKLIHEESTKLMAMVEQVLLLARGRAARPEKRSISPAELLQRSLRASMAGADPPPCKVECTASSDLPPIICNEQAMTQALRNLLDNAVKYGLSGGWVGISAVRQNGHIEIHVADRGPGIPADEQPHVFDEFFRGGKAIDDQIHGTGLGLTLARRIVADHGGDIRVQDHVEGGAEFIASLPIEKDSDAGHPAD